MIVQELVDFLHGIAPNHFQEEYDNSGLLVGDDQDIVNGVLVSLDVTEAVLDEAIALKANVIISHHPIIFSGLKRLTNSNYVQRIVQKAIKHDINLFAIHTNLDNVYHNGVNTYIAKRLELESVEILKPKSDLVYLNQKIGAGVIGYLKKPQDEKSFLSFLKDKMEVKCIKHTNLLDKPVHKVAICGGSGRFLLNDAILQNSDFFISSDFKYHEFFDADNQLVIADIGHFESEQFTIKLLHEILTNKFNNFASHYTKVNTNPVNYF